MCYFCHAQLCGAPLLWRPKTSTQQQKQNAAQFAVALLRQPMELSEAIAFD
jgi:hypothetical protein